ncbi:hypothetical protein COE01_11990 [Bacillus thuringiensis]|uniref:Group-specific protein n=1 Tax=Bacillus thuringiensis TaxID=1428 RepID=A0A9X6TWK2_BACTU|nr:hypothetical protein [Bacillus thuringiensis]PEC71489.1 hypothetical protein CON25_22125 [Bacillus thuringiensis]PED12017.1 hypothetical protein CON01_22890 [Bacillus thuringiensis]PEF83577.1 hypothetical protein CON51_31185 [Bacillus thuringiensis]PES61200.1 hypothetical protein CN506_00790 [Bacillus thuringiensis]PEV02975.1 hypothetical protein CN417_26775 [Bacillus thuringiensis]
MSYGYGHPPKKCCEHHNETLSTGILRRHSATLFLTVDAMNVDPDDTRRVTVEMFDWSSGSPVLLPLIDPSTQTLPPNRYVTFRSAALPPTLFAYEVRIIRPKDRDVVTNVFGLSAIVFNPQEGNNVLQHDLAKLDLK